MESGSLWIQVVVLIILVILSGFFSASETALMSISKMKIRHLKDEGVKGANIVEKITDEPKKLLSTILVGNNVVNIAATSISTSLLLSLFGSQGVAMSTAIMTILILVFGEVTPKTLGSNNKERVCLSVAKIINFLIIVMTPIVFVMNLITAIIFKIFGIKDDDPKSLVTEEELKLMVNVGHEEGVLEHEEREIINNVFEFGDMKAEDAMIQRKDMVTIEADASYEDVLDVFKSEKMSRIPVFEDSVDDIIGILNFKDIVFLTDEEEEKFTVKKYMREPFFTYEFKKISHLLEDMKMAKAQIAIVLDEYGGTSGLLTVEDIIEVLVGDIDDEYDEEDDDIVMVKQDEYIVDGSTKLTDVNEFLYEELESEEFDSIGGYIMGYINGLPDEGQEIELSESTKVKILSLDRNRIGSIKINVVEVERDEDEISFKEYIEKESGKDQD